MATAEGNLEKMQLQHAPIMKKPYTQEWIYPTPMKEEDGRKYRSAKINAAMSTNTANSCNYTFNEFYELVKGNWKLNIYIENELMYSHTFIM